MKRVNRFQIFPLPKDPSKYVDSSTQTEEFDYLVAGVPPQRPLCKDEFQNDNKKVNFYTGLHLLYTLKAVFL